MMSQEQVTLVQALEQIQSGKLDERRKGFDSLKHVLNFNRSDRTLQQLEEKSIHAIFDVLFRVNSSERASYVKGSKGSTGAASASRLALGASALRLAVTVFVDRLRRKTVKAILGHVTQALPTANGSYCEPLSLDYLKALKCVVDYQPHVEHFDRSLWNDVVDFCIDGFSMFDHDDYENAAFSDNGARSSFRNQISASWRNMRATSIDNVVELLGCLQALVSAPNCPLLEKTEIVLATVVRFLKTSPSTTSGHHAALQSINTVLARVSLNSVSLTLQTVLMLLPIYRSLWQFAKKDHTLENEMLVSMIRCQGHLASIAGTENGEQYLVSVEALLDAMYSDYCDPRKSERGRLEIEDLGLDLGIKTQIESMPMPMQTRSFYLRKATAKSERNWTALYFVSFYSSWVDLQRQFVKQSAGDQSGEENAPKRRRILQKLDDILEQTLTEQLDHKRGSLQVLAFIAQQRTLSAGELTSVIESLLMSASHQDGSISSWALLGVAACAYQTNSSTTKLMPFWIAAWNLAIRLLSSIPHCRAACHVLEVLLTTKCVSYTMIASSAETLLSSFSLHGPAQLCDSALGAWSIIAGLKSAQHPGAAVTASYEQMLGWLCSKWSPSNFENRSYAKQVCRDVSALSIYAAFNLANTSQSKTVATANITCLGIIGQTWLAHWSSYDVLNYLLLLDTSSLPFPQRTVHENPSFEISRSLTRNEMKFEGILLRYFTAEAEKTYDVWQGTKSHLTANADMVHVVFSFCIVGLMVCATFQQEHSRRASQVGQQLCDLGRDVIRFSFRSHPNQCDRVWALLEAISPFLPDLNKSEGLSQLTFMSNALSSILSSLTEALEAYSEVFVNGSPANGSHHDLMEIDTDTHNHHSSQDQHPGRQRRKHSAESSGRSFFASTAAYVTFMSQLTNEVDTDGKLTFVPASFIQHLTSLSSEDFLASWPLLSALMASPLQLQTADAEAILKFLGESYLTLYTWSRCESALCSSLSILVGTASLWTDRELESLAEAGADIYQWFLDTALGARILSPNVQVGLVDLLYKLLNLQPDYAQSISRPSIRTMLFSVLKDGEILVQYHVAQRLPVVFSSFVLSQHDTIFDDIHNSLPDRVEWIEGIMLRLLVYTRLGSAWKSLLRRCLFHIFETAGLLPDVLLHATYCVTQLVHALDLTNPQELFRLFSPQLLYTWLETHPLDTIPFQIFAYGYQKSLLMDIRAEIISQLMMRGDDDQLKQFEKITGTSYKSIPNDWFARATAYGIAKDMFTTPAKAKANVAPHNTETRIRYLFGSDEYKTMLARRLHYVVGHLFLRLDQEDQIDKIFSKREEYESAYNVLTDIERGKTSQLALPTNQQPSFGPKAFLDAIERVCRRVKKTPVNTTEKKLDLWQPILIVAVSRMLLNDIHPVFGSPHACRIVRKLRVLICLAGSTVLTGYPLEMLLHAIRPWLTDSQCAEDALGVFQYLLNRGKAHLQQNGVFVAGLCLPVFLSLQEFLRSVQDSCTQESQHRAILSRAQSFHGWLSQYFDEYSPSDLSPSGLQTFGELMNLARRITGPINAVALSNESDFLRVLLRDTKPRGQLLDPISVELCFRILTRSFSAPQSFQDDILGLEEDAKQYTTAVWESLRHSNLSKSYKLWAAKVLGRSFGFDGEIESSICAESNLYSLKRFSRESRPFQDSRVAITLSLVDILQSDCSKAVGFAERSLQSSILKGDKLDESSETEECLRGSLLETFSSRDYDLSFDTATNLPVVEANIQTCFEQMEHRPYDQWTRELTMALIDLAEDVPVFSTLPKVLGVVDGLAEQLFPFILHLVLIRCRKDKPEVQLSISDGFRHCFSHSTSCVSTHIRTLINAVLYLRCQQALPESTPFDRNKWLNLDYFVAAAAAVDCKMLKTATLFLEIAQSPTIRNPQLAPDIQQNQLNSLLLSVFSSLDEPDSFYGVKQLPNIESVVDRLDFEGNGMQSLLFRSAQLDSVTRSERTGEPASSGKLIQSLTRLNLNSITYSLVEAQYKSDSDSNVIDGILNAAFRLGQWDVALPPTRTTIRSTVYRTFQSIHNAPNIDGVINSLDLGLLDIFDQLRNSTRIDASMSTYFQAMASLTEIHDMVSSRGAEQFGEVLTRLKHRYRWMNISRLEIVSPFLTSRAAFMGILAKNERLQGAMHLMPPNIRHAEVDLELQSSSTFGKLEAFQESLSSVTYLSHLIEPCRVTGVKVDVAVKNEIANVLWDRGELLPSIQMLRDIDQTSNFSDQSLPIGRSEILATLGQRVSQARLENPSAIVANYLTPALEELKGASHGTEASHTFHEYASYCHSQLTNLDNIEEFRRSERFRRQKLAEVREIKATFSTISSSREKQQAEKAYRDAERWLRIDTQEYERLRVEREDFLRQSLSSYLRALAASDEFDTDIIRFTALWMEHAENDVASDSVDQLITRVPSRKFATLMNQLGSRLQSTDNSFQTILGNLVERICREHPYHGMYHVFAGSRSTGGSDSQALSRKTGATNIAARLQNNKATTKLWAAISKSNDLLNKLAKHKTEDMKAGTKISLRKLDVSRRVERDVPTCQVPPITLAVELREDYNYSTVPTVASFRPEMSVLAGLSAPKLLTAIGSDGQSYRQLYKGGADDLRQDAIMEQVFAQVTDLLRRNKSTRQRELRIRTYKVVPLDATSGAIEFVQPTLSLLDYLNPAHHRYHPNELNWKACRDKIEKGQDLPQASRIKIFKEVKDRFTPVLRHFFFERFQDPDDWFTRRLAYTRSTAAISILGHVLGLGDRHCQNILLDTRTGEVVHIDLGVAFDAGRILPKPEMVPFRLTRDIVDGFGVLGTEGVFRRCCEFTLEALRSNKDTILTLLNVLRYDPLYSWSVSPLRAKRLQEEQQAAEASLSVTPATAASKRTSRRSGIGAAEAEVVDVGLGERKERKEEEGGEADRALSVVEKKLAGGLSVTAAVSELIQQATDDKNLAVLFHGWAAYA